MNEEWEAKKEAAIREHFSKIGEITMAWSYHHVVLGLWYSILTSPTRDLTEAMRRWDKERSDYNQRAMLVEVLKNKRAKDPAAFDSMVWACEWVNELANVRNAYVHLAVVIRGLPDKAEVDFMEQLHLIGKDNRFKRVKEKPDASHRAALDDLAALSEFAHRTFNAVFTGGKLEPAPPRPELTISKVFTDTAPRPFN